MDSDCVAFTLPGMMELPGRSKDLSAPIRAGPLRARVCVAIFMSAAARFSQHRGMHHRVHTNEALRTCLRGRERQAVSVPALAPPALQISRIESLPCSAAHAS